MNTDVRDARKITAERKAELEACKVRLGKVAEKLGGAQRREKSDSSSSSRTFERLKQEAAEISQKNARDELTAYMNEHGYTNMDIDVYSQDPDWRKLVQQAYPGAQLPDLKDHDPLAFSSMKAFQDLQKYMADHNYGRDDFAEYSQDPEWRRLQQIAYPAYVLPPLNAIGAQNVIKQKAVFARSPEALAKLLSDDPDLMDLYRRGWPQAEKIELSAAGARKWCQRELEKAGTNAYLVNKCFLSDEFRRNFQKGWPNADLPGRYVMGRNGKPVPIIFDDQYNRSCQRLRDLQYCQNNPDTVRKVTSTVKRIMKEGTFCSRVPSGVLDLILTDRFKSQMETGTSRGLRDREARLEVSNYLYDTAPTDRLEDREREKYGYVGFSSSKENIRFLEGENSKFMDHYGDIQIQFRKDRIHATYTDDDTLNVYEGRKIFGVPIELSPGSTGLDTPVNAAGITDFVRAETFMRTGDPGIVRSLVSATPNKVIDRYFRNKQYIELQFAGEMRARDIEAIYVPVDYVLSAQAQEVIDQYGIAIHRYKRRKKENTI